MFEFLDWWSGDAPEFPEDVSNLYVNSIVMEADLGSDRITTVDPAAWHDWRQAVAMTLEDAIGPPLPVPCREVTDELADGTLIDVGQAFVATYQYFRTYWQQGDFSEPGVHTFMLDLWEAVGSLQSGQSNSLYEKFSQIWTVGDLSRATEAFNRND